jgi:hypothetical protein
MTRSTSPRLKHCEVFIAANGFTGGLAGHYLSFFNVSQVDTFIEKPFSILLYKHIRMCNSNQSKAK